MNSFGIRVLRKLGLTDSLHLTGDQSVNGFSFRFPICGPLGWGYINDPESWMTSLLGSLSDYFRSRPQHCFVDVGVNLGQTLVKYQSVNPGGAYVGFEPNATCVAYVSELVQVNQWENIDLYPVGVSDSPQLCALNFFHHSSADSAASMIDDFRPNEPIRKRSHIAVFPMELAGIARSVSFLKIDVEGAELEVLRGSGSVIRKDRPLVSTEILPCYKETNAFRIERQDAVEQLMANALYKCFRIQKKGVGQGELAGLTPIDSIGIHGDIHQSDYLWIPEEKCDEVCALVAKA